MIGAISGWRWVALFLLGACGEQGADYVYEAAVQAAQAASSDTASMTHAVGLLSDFVKRYPEHERTASALMTLAMLTQQRGDAAGAVEQYERLLTRYPDSEYADEAQFMIGFIYEEHLKDMARARAAYEKVIERFPESELAANARQLLPHLGSPPEEWVKFQEGISSTQP